MQNKIQSGCFTDIEFLYGTGFYLGTLFQRQNSYWMQLLYNDDCVYNTPMSKIVLFHNAFIK